VPPVPSTAEWRRWRILSTILSKAFMLAEDTKIKDPSITRQIRAS
jgi:hypothetical protein